MKLHSKTSYHEGQAPLQTNDEKTGPLRRPWDKIVENEPHRNPQLSVDIRKYFACFVGASPVYFCSSLARISSTLVTLSW